MFNNLKERFLSLVASRLFVLIVFFLFLGGVLLNRIFEMQIVNGEDYLNNFTLRIRKERSIASARGNIYDCNGELLAYNELAYNVTIEDVYESGNEKNKKLNATIRRLIQIIEDDGDHIINDFNVVLDKDDSFQFAVEEKQKLRFLADVYGVDTIDKLTYRQQSSTPQEVIDYLAGENRYAIGDYENGQFVVGSGYTKQELLKVITIRYAMSANSFQKYIATVVASDVNEKTVAVVLENINELEGVSIAEDTVRKYVDSEYFSHLLGYTGKISQDELAELSATNKGYSANDMVGKAGIEQVMETELQGKKGTETIYVDNLGKIIETTSRTEPVAGNDLYLTIDKNLQMAVYNILEQKIAGIVVSKIDNIKSFTQGENASASTIRIPIFDVYYALFNNNVIDSSHFSEPDAGETEKEIYSAYLVKKEQVFQQIRTELEETHTPYNELSEEMKAYESYISSMLSSASVGIIQSDLVDTSDETYIAWRKDETISLAEYLQHAIAQNWIDVTKIDYENQYGSSEEIFQKLVDKILENLESNSEFDKKLYRYMISEESITGFQVCNVLLEQKVVNISDNREQEFRSGQISSYNFLLRLIENLDISPAQLALDPCSGSCVVTDVDTGEVRALVTYPGYDTNRLANTIDSKYYAELQADLSRPMWNYATQQKSAPGSTFKMVTATAGLQEGVIGVTDTIDCYGIFDKITPPAKCWIASNGGSHGALNVSGGIEHSCNVFFYEVGYRLGSKGTGVYDSDKGLDLLAKYADMYGLSESSGVEIAESEPSISNMDAVRSAIGQGTHNFTTVGLARYVTAVANSGTVYQLSLLDKLTDNNGNLLKDYTPSVRNKIDLPLYQWQAIHDGMRRVVQNKSYYDDMVVNVAGKTGTAQESRTRPNHALFVGYAPYENPQISVATRVAFGYTSDYAAEISRDVFRYYFDKDNRDEILTGSAARPDAVASGGD